MNRWQGRKVTYGLQVINGLDSLVNLTPASTSQSIATKSNWNAWIRGQTIPLIGERVPNEDFTLDE